MRLASKLIVVFLLVVLVLTTIQGWLAVRRERELFKQEIERAARDFGERLEDTLILAWRSNRPEEVMRLIQQTYGRKPGTRVRWVWFDTFESLDSTGKTVAADFSLERIGQLRPGEPVSFQVTNRDGVAYLNTYYPIAVEVFRHGGLEFSTPLSVLDGRNREIIYQTLLLIAALSLVSIALVGFLGVRMVGHPLERLIEKTRQIGAGNFGEQLSLGRHDELEWLAQALNEMSQRLAEQQERLRAESAARLQTIEQLRHADRLKTVGRLAAGMAHELGTPLNVVSGRAGLIAGGQLNEAEIQRSALTIKQEIDRITQVIRQLLDFARRTQPQRQKVNVVELVNQTLDLLEPFWHQQPLQVVREFAHPAVWALIDAGQIQQVLTNLFMNAWHAMPQGGQLTVRLRERVTESAVQLEIQDTGCGIPESDRELIFEPFFTTKEVGVGTGLGLSIVQGIIEEHGGQILVESQVGVGTCFTVLLPAASHEETI